MIPDALPRSMYRTRDDGPFTELARPEGDCFNALQAAVLQYGGVISLGPGVWPFTIQAARHYLSVPGQVVIQGAGPEATVLYCEREGDDYGWHGWQLERESQVTFRDLTLRGPAAPPLRFDYGPSVQQVMVMDPQDEQAVLFRNVRFEGLPTVHVQRSAYTGLGRLTVQFEDCDFRETFAEHVALFVPDGADVRLHAFRTRWGPSGYLPPDRPDEPFGHSCYLNPNVSVYQEECEFVSAVRMGVHHYSGTGRASSPLYAVYRGCVWRPEVFLPMETTATGRVLLDRCTVDGNQPIQVRRSLEARHCTFPSSSTAANIYATTTAEAVLVADSVFTGGGAKVAAGRLFQSCGIRLQDCEIRRDRNYLAQAIVASDPQVTWELEETEFSNADGSALNDDLYIQAGQVTVRRCRFTGRRGRFPSSAAVRLAADYAGQTRLDECRFDVSQGYAINAQATTAGVLSGLGNEMVSGAVRLASPQELG